VAATLEREVSCSWSDQLERLGEATSLAKTLNVTLAVRNAPETFAAATHDLKRVSKEADSAWLRLGPEPEMLSAGSDSAALAPNTVLLWSDLRTQSAASIAAMAAAFTDFRGHVAIDERSGAADAAAAAAAMRRWREELNRT
jgi:hypothetical protein